MSQAKPTVEIDADGAWSFARAFGWSLTVHRDMEPIDGDPYSIGARMNDDCGTTVALRAYGLTPAEAIERLMAHIPEGHGRAVEVRLKAMFAAIAGRVRR